MNDTRTKRKGKDRKKKKETEYLIELYSICFFTDRSAPTDLKFQSNQQTTERQNQTTTTTTTTTTITIIR